jgi:YD repeat-containing protein
MKISQIIVLSILIIFIIGAKVQGQAVHPKQPSITPVSPNAAEFAKYSETQLNLSTGANILTIPLHTIEMEGLSWPISLSYSGTAIRVDQMAGTYGLGWVLNGAGMISLSKVDGIGTKALREIGGFEVLESNFDGGTIMPVLYNYNFNGYSGQFFYNTNGHIVNLGDPRLQIIEVKNSILVKGFKIITPDGITYYFGEEESYNYSFTYKPEYTNKTGLNSAGTFNLDMPLYDYMNLEDYVTIPNLYYNGQNPEPSYSDEINQWLLRKISFPNSNEIMEFHYDTTRVIVDGPPDQYCLTEEYAYVPIDQIVNPFELVYIHRSFTFSRSNDRPLLSIIWPSGKISFEMEGRLDGATFERPGSILPSGEGEITYTPGGASSAIKRMKIYDNNNLFLKGFNFNFKYSNSSSSDPLSKRLLLSTVNEYSINSKMPPYIFTYGFNMPHLLSNAQDFFGYYNGKDFKAFGPASYGTVKIMHKIPYLTNLGPGRQTNPMTSTQLQAYLNNLNLDETHYPSPFLIDLGYSRQIDNGTTKLYYDRRPTEDMKVGLLERVEYPTGGIDAFSYTADTVQYYYKGEFRGLIGAGVRLAGVYRTYGLGDQPPLEKKYFYENGKLLYLPFFAKSYFDAAPLEVNKIRDVFYGNPINKQNGSVVMHPKVTEVIVNYGKTVYEYDVPSFFGSNSNSTFEIDSRAPELFYFPKSTANYPQYHNKLDYYPYSSTSNYDWANGKLLKQTTYDLTGKKIEQIDNEYDEVLYGNYNSFEIVLLNDIVKKLGYSNIGLDVGLDGAFRFSKSHLISAWRPLIKSTKTVFDPIDPNKFLIEITNYTYNKKNQLVSSETKTNSDGKQYISKYRYVNEFYELGVDDESLIIQELQTKHMINTLIESSNYYCDPLLDTTKFLLSSYLTLYNNFDQKILPWRIESIEPLTPLDNFIPIHNDMNSSNLIKDEKYTLERTFTKYNNRGKLVEMLDRKSGYVSFIWGYNQSLPIAKIDNARISLNSVGNESSYIGFESGSFGSADQEFWSINSSKANRVLTSFTGKYGLKAQSSTSPFMYRVFESDGGIKKIFVSGWVKISQDEYYNIQPKEFKVELIDEGGNVVSNETFFSNPNMTDWKYFSALLDLPSNSEAGNIISYKIQFKNPTDSYNYDLIFDDLRVHPYQSSMITYNYNDTFDLPTSVSDDRNIPTHYEYDEFGRLISVKDYKKDILKTNIYMYSPK